ncbi:hypothetical protein B0H12DRAFT_1120897 [Mycena haematopus]|nr:hypothetical protein B0H12DRAFT_1120897 [Mycena haematopus]
MQQRCRLAFHAVPPARDAVRPRAQAEPRLVLHRLRLSAFIFLLLATAIRIIIVFPPRPNPRTPRPRPTPPLSRRAARSMSTPTGDRTPTRRSCRRQRGIRRRRRRPVRERRRARGASFVRGSSCGAWELPRRGKDGRATEPTPHDATRGVSVRRRGGVKFRFRWESEGRGGGGRLGLLLPAGRIIRRRRIRTPAHPPASSSFPFPSPSQPTLPSPPHPPPRPTLPAATATSSLTRPPTARTYPLSQGRPPPAAHIALSPELAVPA